MENSTAPAPPPPACANGPRLAQHVRDVGLRRPARDPEPRRDLRIAQSLDHERRDLRLAWGERGRLTLVTSIATRIVGRSPSRLPFLLQSPAVPRFLPF